MYPKFLQYTLIFPIMLQYMVVKSECKRSDKSVKDNKMVVKCECKRSAVRQLEQNRSSKKGRGEKRENELLFQQRKKAMGAAASGRKTVPYRVIDNVSKLTNGGGREVHIQFSNPQSSPQT